ncbi:MAG: hypothetical protein WBD07_18290 [Vicinamibacterales bacterium]
MRISFVVTVDLEDSLTAEEAGVQLRELLRHRLPLRDETSVCVQWTPTLQPPFTRRQAVAMIIPGAIRERDDDGILAQFVPRAFDGASGCVYRARLSILHASGWSSIAIEACRLAEIAQCSRLAAAGRRPRNSRRSNTEAWT